MSLTKEDMALEALIKAMTEINQFILNGNPLPLTDMTYKYAIDALSANGWILVGNECGISKHRKIDA